MRWLLLSAVIYGLSITDVASRAEGPPADQRLSLSRSTPEDAGFFATTGVVKFQIVQGRLCLDPPRHRKGSQSRDQEGVYESITVTAERGIPSLHYICQHPHQHLTLSVEKARHVRIESYCPQSGERSVLNQPRSGVAQWTLQEGGENVVHSGATLLHLREADPDQFDIHHGRLIERLLRGQSLGQLSEATFEAMIRQIENGHPPDTQTIHQSIEDLRAPRRAQRVAAERQLLRWGTPIVPIVASLDSHALDAEQRDRLQSILGRLRRQINDTPASLAMLLIVDEDYWSLLAPRLSDDQRLAANDHLRRSGLTPLLPEQAQAQRLAAAND